MPDRDLKLAEAVDEFGTINVLALVEYLMLAHPDADALELVTKILDLIDAGPYTAVI
jgi:hypothetical protein